ncbi:MAG: cyclic nucleotide-binding domain-containing protein [Pseudomonadota bacterium]
MYDTTAEERFKDGAIVYAEGSHGDWIYLITSGHVEMLRAFEGNSHVIETLGPGEIFGEVSFFSGAPRLSTARAKGDIVLEILDRSMLDTEYNRLSEDFQAIVKRLANRYRLVSDALLRSRLRRQAPRYRKVLSMSFKTRAGLVSAFSENVNTDGMFIRSQQVMPKGEQFLLKLDIPGGGETLQIGCEVAWSRPAEKADADNPAGMGVKFIQIGASERSHLKTALKGTDVV